MEILLELARTTKAADSSMPSNMEWRALLDVCAGTLAATAFPVIAETMMSLAGSGDVPRQRYTLLERPHHIDPCAAPQSIATALRSLAEVSAAKIEQVVISGRTSSGWLAAVAVWFFTLRVKMVTDATEAVLYCNYDEADDYQVLFRCKSNEQVSEVRVEFMTCDLGNSAIPAPVTESARPKRTARFTTQHSFDNAPDAPVAQPDRSSRRWRAVDGVSIEGKTHRIDLQDATEILINDQRIGSSVSGRVKWQQALSATFASGFGRLMRQHRTLGELVGCAGRISQALATADACIDPKWLRQWSGYHATSFGSGFMNSVADWFPELWAIELPLQECASRQGLDLDFAQAKEWYDACLDELRLHCQCSGCQKEKDCATLETYCLAQIAETVIFLCHLLSDVSLPSSLYPSKRGLQLAYARLHIYQDEDAHPDWGFASAWITPLLIFGDHHILLDQRRPNKRLIALLELFTGRTASQIVESDSLYRTDCVAIWTNGITVFNGLLRGTGCESQWEVYVVPGRIRFKGTPYKSIRDSVNTPGPLCDFETARAIVHSRQKFDRQTLLVSDVSEASTGLLCSLQLSDQVGRHLDGAGIPGAVTTGVSAFTSFLASHRGLISCKHRSHDTHLTFAENPITSNWTGGRNWRLRDTDTGRILLLNATSSSQLLALVATTSHLAQKDQTFTFHVVHEECWSCCLAMAGESPLGLCFIRAPRE